MRYWVRLSKAADRDILRLEDFLAVDSRAVADKATKAIRDALESLQQFPERGRPIGQGRRELVVLFGGSAYLLRYRVSTDVVVVIRIIHSKERR